MELKGRRIALSLAILSLAAASPVAIAQPNVPADIARNPADERLALIFADDARREDEVDPLDALYRGEEVEPAALAEVFTDALDRKRLASAQRTLRALSEIDRSRLSAESRISFDVLSQDKREQIAWLQPEVRSLTGVRPFNHFGGLHVEFPSLLSSDGVITFDEESDYRRALLLNAEFAGVIDNAILRFRQGMATDVVESKLTVGNMIGQVDALLAQDVKQSPFYSPVLNFPETVVPARRTALQAAYAAVIRDSIYPAYRRLRRFLAEDYLPVAREQVGISAMKGGPDLYHRLIEQETTLRLEPEEVHKLGLSEVARIQHEMDGVRQKMGFAGDLTAFFNHVRDDPRFHPKTREELEQGFAAIRERVAAQIPRFFARVPRTPLIVQPYPAYREKYEPGGSYQPGSTDGSRPGIFYFNAYDLPSRFLTGMATLYLHEGSPGHHFQISLARENTALPSFQRFDGNSAFVEGWALYAETLGFEMGLYDDPMQHWGTLDDEMLRAMRLVVDTGLHAKNWTREQAINYMLANSGMGRTDATAEVDRYIANPAQALSYKIGALTIQRLRKKAQEQLGSKFDIRAFHEQVLGSGALPLPILEAKIDSWIAATK